MPKKTWRSAEEIPCDPWQELTERKYLCFYHIGPSRAGYSCGLFTSPHLVEINERFQINEEVIDDDTFLRAFEKVKKLPMSWLRREAIIPPILRHSF